MSQNPYSVSELPTSGDIQSLGPKFDQQLRVMQNIAVALIMGVLMFLGVVLVSTKGDVFGQNEPPFLTIFAAAVAGVMVVGHIVVPSIVARSQLTIANGQTPTDQTGESRTSSLATVFQVQMIIALAMLEGAAFLNLNVLMTEKHVVSTVLVACLVLLMVIKFPTRTKVSWWIQNRLGELNM